MIAKRSIKIIYNLQKGSYRGTTKLLQGVEGTFNYGVAVILGKIFFKKHMHVAYVV